MIPQMIYNMGTNILRAVGDSKRPLYFLIVASIVNIVLDIVLVAVIPLGVAGAAIATVASQVVSAVLTVRCIHGSQGMPWHLQLKNIRIERSVLLAICRIGLPGAAQSALYSISNMTIQSAINGFGTVAVAAWSVYGKIDFLFWMTVSSFGIAVTTFAGQNYGAGRLDRVKKGTWVTLAMGLVYTLATGALLLLGQDAIMHLFTNDETVVFFGEAAMHWFCPFYFLLSILHGLAGAVRGTGASVPPMVVLLVSLCLFRIVWIQWLLPLFSGIDGVFILYPVSWALGAGLMILYAWKGKWMEYHA